MRLWPAIEARQGIFFVVGIGTANNTLRKSKLFCQVIFFEKIKIGEKVHFILLFQSVTMITKKSTIFSKKSMG